MSNDVYTEVITMADRMVRLKKRVVQDSKFPPQDARENNFK